jgi:hypothetical protein
MPPLRYASAVFVAASLVLTAACSSSSAGNPTSPSSSAAPATSPLTGLAKSGNPVVAVKIEDTALGRPQVGIDKADIVYVEQVEGGLTRLLAVFNSSLPKVEPVRSVRPSDPELAEQFGNIILVASGGSRAGIAPLIKSPLHAVINDRGDAGFTRDPNRNAPENLRANLAAIAAKTHGPQAADIGLTWSTRLTGPSKRGTTVRTRIGNTDVGFQWKASARKYVRIIDGAVQKTAAGALIETPNVVVQFCHITKYAADRDVLGNPAQYTHTVGQGRAVVFRNGRRIEGTWSRPSVQNGTSLRTAAGRPIALMPGGAWFVLVATNAQLG